MENVKEEKYQMDGKCVCPNGSVLKNGVCEKKVSCKGGILRNGKCICPRGSNLINGECKKKK